MAAKTEEKPQEDKAIAARNRNLDLALQKIAKEMATAATMEVRSERILPPVERGELLEIPVEIAVSGEIRNLVELLARLESAPKLLAVQDLKVRVMNIAQPKDLLATITVSGFMIPSNTKT